MIAEPKLGTDAHNYVKLRPTLLYNQRVLHSKVLEARESLQNQSPREQHAASSPPHFPESNSRQVSALVWAQDTRKIMRNPSFDGYRDEA
jgi:hypothetical protein